MDINEIRRANYTKLLNDMFEGMPSQMADSLKVPRTSLSRFFSTNKAARRNIGGSMARLIEKGCRRPRGWLDQPHDDAVEKIPSIRVPVLAWSSIGQWVRKKAGSVRRPDSGNEGNETMLCPLEAGPRAYCLRVEGDSNKSANGASIMAGEMIYVDPDREPSVGKFVIVLPAGQKHALLRKMVIDGGERWLEATNPTWPERLVRWPKTAQYCGLVIGKTSFL